MSPNGSLSCPNGTGNGYTFLLTQLDEFSNPSLRNGGQVRSTPNPPFLHKFFQAAHSLTHEEQTTQNKPFIVSTIIWTACRNCSLRQIYLTQALWTLHEKKYSVNAKDIDCWSNENNNRETIWEDHGTVRRRKLVFKIPLQSLGESNLLKEAKSTRTLSSCVEITGSMHTGRAHSQKSVDVQPIK